MSEQTPRPDYEFIQFPGQVHLIQTEQELSKAAAALSSASVLGFDTETKPAFKKGDVFPVALLQLSTDTDAYLIRLQALKQYQPIAQIFNNADIVKVGVAIRDDIKALQKMFLFAPQNFVELQDVAKTKALKNMGLKGMTEEVLGVTLSKRAKISNWEANPLTPQQVIYAATDAWIGLQLFKKLHTVG